VAGGESSISNWELNFEHPVQVIGPRLTTLVQHELEMFADVVAEYGKLIEVGVYGRTQTLRVWATRNPRSSIANVGWERRRTVEPMDRSGSAKPPPRKIRYEPYVAGS
jgi:hypothetical protein